MTRNKRVELYRRLPEIYRIKDEELPEAYLSDGEQVEAFQLKSFLEPVEEMFSAIHENIESLYHDLFIETCDEWVIPYIADLLGTTHLSGDAWTLRADVADTILLRRRKGTLYAIELLAFDLTKWGVHAVELMENMAWNQHLNHQRPDKGGVPPYGLPGNGRKAPVRGGTVNLRDPALLDLLNKPFDPFAHLADVKPPGMGQVRYNLPNLAIFLWRLKDYRLKGTKPRVPPAVPQDSGNFALRVNINPVTSSRRLPTGRPVRLFNTNRSGPLSNETTEDESRGPVAEERLSTMDGLPEPISPARLGAFSGKYVTVNHYDPADPGPPEINDLGLQIHLPISGPGSTKFFSDHKIRSENLCAWEQQLNPPLADGDIAIDPEIGRICIGVPDLAKAEKLRNELLLTYTYGAVGDVGAHPISYPELPAGVGPVLSVRKGVGKSLQQLLGEKLKEIHEAVADDATLLGKRQIVIEIADSFTHRLDIGAFDSTVLSTENGRTSVMLTAPLIIRAADQERPIIKLAKPLAFRPEKIDSKNPDTNKRKKEQSLFDSAMDALFVRLEGLYIEHRRAYEKTDPLISGAALNRLEILNCTLDPGGFRRPNGSRARARAGLELSGSYECTTPAEEREFKQTPEINIQRSICGAIFIDEGYRLCVQDSIVESFPARISPDDPADTRTFAITSSTRKPDGYAAPTVIRNATILGPVRTARIEGSGGIFTGVLEVLDEQSGCLKYCYFADDSKNRLPQNFGCVLGSEARLIFTSEFFADAAYCQLSLECDRRILEEGPGGDQMGAYNFLMEAHKWRNLRIRFREFMPVGIRPLLIPADTKGDIL